MGPRLNCGRSLYDYQMAGYRYLQKLLNGSLEAVRAGKRGMSVEFYSMKESRNRAGVREIQRAFVSGVALVSAPEYSQGVAEIRSKRRRRFWL